MIDETAAERLERLERQARERGSDHDPSGRYVFDPDAERLDAELVDDLAGGLTAEEREQCRTRERAFTERLVDRCDVCGERLAVGQPRRHGVCSPTCADCHRPAIYCSCSATVRRKRAAAAAS